MTSASTDTEDWEGEFMRIKGASVVTASIAAMTYMLDGEQFIVVATGGSNLPAELIALRLSK